MDMSRLVPDDYLNPDWPAASKKLSSWKDLVSERMRLAWQTLEPTVRAERAQTFREVAERMTTPDDQD